MNRPHDFDAAELPPITTLEGAQLALDAVRIAVLTGKITSAQARSASGAVDSWIRANTALVTQRLVGELRGELAAKAKEIEALRKKLGRR